MSFDCVLGNETVKSLLTHTLASGHIGHAYILEGSRGVGRMTMAKAFAAGLLQTENPDAHPDFTVVTNQLYDPSKKQDTLLVDTIRNLKRDVYIRPYAGDRKVYVLPRADTMQAPAQNSLLKIFEEPPSYCVILLLAENANAFLPTIRSRAQILRMHPLSQDQVKDYLIDQKQLSQTQAQQLSILSGGSIGKALELLEDETAVNLREETLTRLLTLSGGGYRELYDFIRFLKQNRTSIDFVLEILLSWSRDAMFQKLSPGQHHITNTDKTAELSDFCGKLTRKSALRLGEIILKYQKMIAQNANYSAAVLCMATEYWEEIHGRNYRS